MKTILKHVYLIWQGQGRVIDELGTVGQQLVGQGTLRKVENGLYLAPFNEKLRRYIFFQHYFRNAIEHQPSQKSLRLATFYEIG